jgi:hypothetical protein
VAAGICAGLSGSSGQRAILSTMSKCPRRRDRQRPQPPAPSISSNPPRTAERMLLGQIADGVPDPHLQALAQATDARLHPLHTVATQAVLTTLCAGDEVRINNTMRPTCVD